MGCFGSLTVLLSSFWTGLNRRLGILLMRFACLQINFTIPESMPAGKYLVRVEQFTWWPEIQFYLTCAHVEVRGSGKGMYILRTDILLNNLLCRCSDGFCEVSRSILCGGCC